MVTAHEGLTMKKPLFFRQFDYKKNLLPNAHLASLEEGVTTIAEAEEKTGWSIGYPGWGVIYHMILSQLRPDTHNILLETGANQGCSTIILAQALLDSGHQGHVHTIEIESEFVEIASNNLEKAGVQDVVTIHHGNSKEILTTLAPELGSIRFAFLDGSHAFEDVMKEFELIEPYLDKGAIVLMDNTYAIADQGEDPRVHGALPAIIERWGGSFINLEFVSWYTPGLAIWQRDPFTLAEL